MITITVFLRSVFSLTAYMLAESIAKKIIPAVAVAKQKIIFAVFRFAEDIKIFSVINNFVLLFPMKRFCFWNCETNKI